MDLFAATVEQLQAEYFRLAGVVQVAQNERQQIQSIIERRLAEARSKDRIRAMSVIERDALAAVLKEEAAR